MNNFPPKPYEYAKGTVILPYDLGKISSTIEIDDETLFVKPEFRFHMSIFPVKDWLTYRKDKTEEENERSLLKKAADLLEQFPVTLLKLKNEYRLAKKDEKKTVVVMCEAINLDKFAEGMTAFVGIEVPTQPAHVTIYAREGGAGIGLWSLTDLNAITRPLSEKEINIVQAAMHSEQGSADN